jgi:hypothetical protein
MYEPPPLESQLRVCNVSQSTSIEVGKLIKKVSNYTQAEMIGRRPHIKTEVLLLIGAASELLIPALPSSNEV